MAYNGPFPYTNTGTTGAITVKNTSFTGNVGNAGTISSGGISVSHATIDGQISNSGFLSGGISLDATSLISSAISAIELSGPTFTGGIRNAGTLDAGRGIDVNSGTSTFGGGVTNSGVINAQSSAVVLAGVADFTGGVTNKGTIGSRNGSGIVVYQVSTFSGGVNNSGTVAVADDGLNVDSVANVGAGTFAGSIINTGAGKISAHETAVHVSGVGNAGFFGNISNSGKLSSIDGRGIDFVSVGVGATSTGSVGIGGTFSGSIVNSNSILAYATGVFVGSAGYDEFSGGISNSGSIASTISDGIVVNDVALGNFSFGKVHIGTFAGSIINSGTGKITALNGVGIRAQNVAGSANDIFGVGDSFVGSISNAGAITASTGISVDHVGAAYFSGGIDNTGTIVAANGGVEVANVAAVGPLITPHGGLPGQGSFSGSIENSGAGIIKSGRTGIYVNNIGLYGFSGGIGNSGKIASTGGKGIAVQFVANSNGALGQGGVFSGSISNGGTITSKSTAMYVNNVGFLGFSGHISNTGTITSTDGKGLEIANVADDGVFDGSIVNHSTISANATGLDIIDTAHVAFVGSISNSGKITATNGRGLLVNFVADGPTAILDPSTYFGSIVNSNAITAQTGIVIAAVAAEGFSGGITNSGAITAVKNGVQINNIATGIVANFTGNIVNSGNVAAANGNGITVNNLAGGNFTGNFVNSGKITAGIGNGIDIESVAVGTTSGSVAVGGTFSGSIVNSNAISAYFTGMRAETVGVFGFSGGISNGGAITATASAGLVLSLIADRGTFTGNIGNSGAIAAFATGIEVTSVGGVGFSGNITNSAKVVSTDGAGFYVSNVAANGTFTGNIVNSGTISSYETGIQVNTVGGLGFSGGITNTGHISTDRAGLVVANVPSLIGNIVNSGSISGQTGIFIETTTIQGSIIDKGTISASRSGIFVSADAEIVSPQTAIAATGAVLTGGITNLGVISGSTGILVSAAGVNVFDGGTISGGVAVELKGASDSFTLGGGYSIAGTVSAAGTNAGFQLGGTGSGSFDLAAIGGQFAGFRHFSVDGGDWTVSSAGGSAWTIDAGTLEATSGTVLSGATIVNGGLLQIDSGASVTGGPIEIGNGVAHIVSGGSAATIDFLANGVGGLVIDDAAGQTSAFGGMVSGFGGVSHGNKTEFIDLTSVTFVSGGAISGSYSGNTTSGTLTVTSSATTVAMIDMSGSYATSNFHFKSGASGSVEITDPTPVGGGVASAGPVTADMALFVNYLAASFVTAGGMIAGGQLLPEQTSPLLAKPHA